MDEWVPMLPLEGVRVIEFCNNAALYAGLPAMDRLKEGPDWELITTGDWVKIDADRGIVEVTPR